MSHPHPVLIVSGVQLEGSADSKAPALADVDIRFGVDSHLDFQAPEMMTFSVLVTEGQIGHLKLGAEVVLFQPDEGITWFTGRITRLSARLDARAKRFTVRATCVSLLSEVVNRQVVPVFPEETGNARESRLVKMTGWQHVQRREHFGWSRAAARNAKQPVGILTLLDQNLRAARRVRRDISVWDQARRRITRRMETMSDIIRLVGGEHLYTTASGRWKAEVVTGEDWGGKVLKLSAEHFRADDVEFVQEPEDLITRLQVETAGERDGDRKTLDATRYYPPGRDAVSAAGDRLLTISTDLKPNAGERELFPLAGHHISRLVTWRVRKLRIHDSSVLSLRDLETLIAPAHRFGCYLVVEGVTLFRPASIFSSIRGAVIGGSARWTGKKWDIELTLGRSSEGRAINPWTFDQLRDSPVPAIADATFASVGPVMTIGDFRRIEHA